MQCTTISVSFSLLQSMLWQIDIPSQAMHKKYSTHPVCYVSIQSSIHRKKSLNMTPVLFQNLLQLQLELVHCTFDRILIEYAPFLSRLNQIINNFFSQQIEIESGKKIMLLIYPVASWDKDENFAILWYAQLLELESLTFAWECLKIHVHAWNFQMVKNIYWTTSYYVFMMIRPQE